MIRPVRIHGIFETVSQNVNNKGLSPSEWLEKKALYKQYLDSLNINDPDLYKRLLEEFDDGLLFNIEFKFLMYDLGFDEIKVDEIINQFDGGEKPYGTNDLDLDKSLPQKVFYIPKGYYKNPEINPSDVVGILSQPIKTVYYEEEIKRGR